MALPALISGGSKAVADLEALAEQAADFAAAAIAENTRLAYRKAFRTFTTWCGETGFDPLPAVPATVGLYLTHLATAGRTVSTMEQALAALAFVHRQAGEGFDTKHPAIANTFAGIKRTIGTAKMGKAPLVADDIRAMLATVPSSTVAGLRDRALILLGFASALRRSELMGLDLGRIGTGTGYIELTSQGILVHLMRSKTDQEGQGQMVGVARGRNMATCPVRAVQAWMQASAASAGAPLFRSVNRHGRAGAGRLSDRAAVDMLKRVAAAAAIDPERVAGHSLRSGHATTAAQAGAAEDTIQRQLRHKKADTTRGYIRRATVFDGSSSAALGL
ncbi:site-specific recombinase XerD [Azospirillum sp. OGB3]|uniref:site-specific integrase n=1 Tax=Azospirillum sp. OGB3 TaxID=2587012 RepID=UPI00160689E3|nr:site-specific integrase [Azospirillum sp. OGB3]MBB3267600.1 site-specific recombinase XerD [Azospirillum sp. OGB3]